jgi:hypothetical protein
MKTLIAALIATASLSVNAMSTEEFLSKVNQEDITGGSFTNQQVQTASHTAQLCLEVACENGSQEYRQSYYFLKSAQAMYSSDRNWEMNIKRGISNGKRQANKIRKLAEQGKQFEIELEYEGFWNNYADMNTVWEDAEYLDEEGYYLVKFSIKNPLAGVNVHEKVTGTYWHFLCMAVEFGSNEQRDRALKIKQKFNEDGHEYGWLEVGKALRQGISHADRPTYYSFQYRNYDRAYLDQVYSPMFDAAIAYFENTYVPTWK